MKLKITALLLCAILMSSCSEYSRVLQTDSIESDVPTETIAGSVDPDETMNEDTETEEMFADVENPVQLDDPVTVISNAGNLTVHSILLPASGERSGYTAFAYNDRYSIYLTYDYERNDGITSYHNLTLYVIDAMDGNIVCESSLDTTYKTSWISYTDTGCVIFAAEVEDGIYTVNCAYSIDKTDDGFTVSETEIEAYPSRDQYFYTPDGTTAAYYTSQDGYGDGGIDIRYPDGEVKRILDSNMLDEVIDGKVVDLGGVTGYTPHGFIDNTHLVYSITGWEWLKGYGIYDISNDTKTEVYGTYRPIGIHDGILYIDATEKGIDTYTIESAEIWKVTSDGEKTVIASTEETEGLFNLTFDRYYTFEHSKWVFAHTGMINGISFGDGQETMRVSVYSADLTELLAEIEYPKDPNALVNFIVYGDTVTVVARASADVE